MSAKRDGGTWALAGYLYQIVGALGIGARAYIVDVATAEDIDIQLGLTDVSQSLLKIQHEPLGQDALLTFQSLGITSNDHAVAVQFKFSAHPLDNKIDEPELAKILKSFSDSRKQAQDEKLDLTACVLITNRPFTNHGGGAQKLWDDSKQVQGDKLRLVHDYPLARSSEFLQQFALEYGATEKEIQGGIDNLLGMIMQQPRITIHERDLIRAFTEYSDTRRLTVKDILPQCIEKLRELDKSFTLPQHIVRREISDELARMCSEHALIVLHGHGGCGKSVALRQWLIDTKTTMLFTPIQRVSSGWVVNEICDWANLPIKHDRRNEAMEDAIERLVIANSKIPLPIFHLGLDSLDEATLDGQSSHSLKTIINSFEREEAEVKKGKRPRPRATLIITCRDLREVQQKWLTPDISGLGKTEPPKEIRLDIFTREEWRQAISGSHLNSSVIERLEMSDIMVSSFASTPFSSPRILPALPVKDLSIIEGLRHPVVWYTFVEELEPDLQTRVLDADEHALSKLAERFVDRFCRKAIDRGKLGRIKEALLLNVLCLIATHCDNHLGPLYEYNSDWAAPSFQHGSVNVHESREIFEECLSHGVIKPDGYKWYWSFEWIKTYLSNANRNQI